QGLQHRPPHLPGQALRGHVEGLRVLAGDHGGALGGRLLGCPSHPRPPGSSGTAGYAGWCLHLRPRRARPQIAPSPATDNWSRGRAMNIADVRPKAFAMPLNDPAYPRPPYKFYNREFVVITYRTDPELLRAVVPEPLEVIGDTVSYEFIRMPDSTGFGDYTETGQVIPVRFTTPSGDVQEGGYVHAMYLDDNSPIAGGREIWGFPKKL